MTQTQGLLQFLGGVVLIATGSVLGGAARYFISGVVARRIGETFPWGTMTVNVSGSFVIGVLAALATHRFTVFSSAPFWLFAVTGFLGCYTTVSSFSLQTLMLASHGETRAALQNITLALGLCLAAVAGGFSLADFLATSFGG
ncbi:MAG: fluoride efflux transporter CrcB [Alphaproteobacteria bacterium]|nr:fluoride efflux transporter CrcB [Alphaproteobacteria bacterium]